MISSKHYHNNEHFSIELERIFYNNWLFVGTRNELAKNNDFITLDFGKYSVVIQNIKGSIYGHSNICLHRFNKIQVERNGNRPLFCSYHGWSYAPDGTARVPKKFQDNELPLESFKLDTFKVDNCGIFYFIKLPQNQQSLTDFLGEYYKILQEFSEFIGKEIYNEVMPHKANWKLLIENVLECYHCKIVHSKTFIPMGIGITPPINFRRYGKHNDCEYPQTKSEKSENRNNKLSFLRYKKYQHASYHHIFIYPNLFISSTVGNLFYIGNLIPNNPDNTSLIVRFYTPVLNFPSGIKASQFLIDAFFDAAIHSALTVLQEDKVILENIQSVIRNIDREPIFGNEEFRINEFYSNYFSDLNKQRK